MELNRIPFGSDWKFHFADDPASVQPVSLPHDWQIASPLNPDMPHGGAQGYYDRRQIGVYEKTFFAPEEWRGKDVTVLFDGIQRFSEITLNGEKVGGRPYGYVPVLVDLKNLRIGEENTLTVTVDNLNHGPDRWYSGAGIYRHAWLLVRNETRIAHDGVWVRAGADGKGTVSVTVEGEPAGMELCISVLSPDGDSLLEKKISAQVESVIDFSVENPQLWSPESPTLYRVEVRLGDDVHAVRFGFRDAEFDGDKGFLLNGKSVKFKGVNLHHDGGCVGAAVPIEIWKRRFDSLKQMGCNAIRCSHNPPTEEFLDLCDEYGFLVIDELYDKWDECPMYYNEFVPEWHAEDMKSMVLRDRNHPSIILWSVGNEVWGQFTEHFYEFLAVLKAECKALDPTRPVSCALIGLGMKAYNWEHPMEERLAVVLRYAEIVDVFMGNYMESFYKALRDAGMKIPVIGSEIFQYHRFEDLSAAQLSRKSAWAICKDYDWVCGGFIWAGIDYLGESMGYPSRGWPGCPIDATSDWKPGAWYAAADWKDEPVLKLAVYDEAVKWDTTRGNWAFPPMRCHWNYCERDRIKFVGCITNCDEVRLFLTNKEPRRAYAKDFPDQIIWFDVPFSPGTLRAEGYKDGVLVAVDEIHSDHMGQIPVLTLPSSAKAGEVIHADVIWNDKYGDRYELEDRPVEFSVTGPAEIPGVENGDLSSPSYYGKTRLDLFRGHAMAVIRATGRGSVTVRAKVEGRPVLEKNITIL